MASWSAVDLQQVVGRYGDFIALVGFLPVFSHIKFGDILKAQTAQARAETPEAKSAAPARELPGAAALWLLMAGDLLVNFGLFQPSEKTVVRAVREVAQAQSKSQPGFMHLLETAARLLTKDDVYVLVRLLAHAGAVGGMAIMVTLGLHEMQSNSPRSGHPIKELWRAAKQLLTAAKTPNLWFFSALAASFVVGNWTVLAKLAAKSSIKDALQALGVLVRTLGAVVAFWGQTGGPMPTWAATQGAAAFIRGSHRFLYERVSLETLLSDGLLHPGGRLAGSSAVASLQGALALEAVICLFCFLSVLRQPRLALLTGVLSMPAAVALDGGQHLRLIEAQMTAADAAHKLAIATSATALMTVFMGGILTMISFVGLLQVLGYLHRLDKLKL